MLEFPARSVALATKVFRPSANCKPLLLHSPAASSAVPLPDRAPDRVTDWMPVPASLAVPLRVRSAEPVVDGVAEMAREGDVVSTVIITTSAPSPQALVRAARMELAPSFRKTMLSTVDSMLFAESWMEKRISKERELRVVSYEGLRISTMGAP